MGQQFEVGSVRQTLFRLQEVTEALSEASEHCRELNHEVAFSISTAQSLAGAWGGSVGDPVVYHAVWRQSGLDMRARDLHTMALMLADMLHRTEHILDQIAQSASVWPPGVRLPPEISARLLYPAATAIDALANVSSSMQVMQFQGMAQFLADPGAIFTALDAVVEVLAATGAELRRLTAHAEALTANMEADDRRMQERSAGPSPADRATQPTTDGSPTDKPPTSVFVRAFHPRVATVQSWHTLLAYVHVEAALQAVRADAKRFSDELGPTAGEAGEAISHPLPRGVTVTIVPRLANVEFNPPAASFRWTEDWHRASFRFNASPSLAGFALNGEVAVYASLAEQQVPIAAVHIAVVFQAEPGGLSSAEVAVKAHASEASAAMYKSIFMSYAHEDEAVATDCATVYEALGITVNIDKQSLKPGQFFEPALMRLIERSDVFQLFWSQHSAESSFVRKEWEHALQCHRGEGFIRPLYWDDPMAPPPPELADIHFTRLHRASHGTPGDNL